MMLFLLSAALLVAVVLALLLPPLLGFGRKSAGSDRETINVALFRDRLHELEQERDDGAIGAEQFDAARLELERDLLLNVDSGADAAGSRPRAATARWTAIVVAVAIPLGAGLLYWRLGDSAMLAVAPAASVAPVVAEQGEAAAPASGSGMVKTDMSTMLARLQARLAKQPDDPQGWALLARGLAFEQRYAEAVPAFEEAIKRDGKRADLLSDFADALSQHTGSMQGRPLQLAQQALALDPNDRGGLWLTGVAAFEKNKFREAIAQWEKLRKLVGNDPDSMQQLNDAIGTAYSRLGEPQPWPPAAATAPTAPETAGAAAPQGGTSAAVALHLQVSLDPRLAAQAPADATVFILARAPGGGMPLAAVRRTVGDLPAAVTLDESSAPMAGGRTLGQFAQLQVVARVSLGGSPMGQPGDLEGSVTVETAKAGQPIQLVIDSVRK